MDRTSQRTTPRVHPAQRPDGGKGAQKVGSNTGERWLGQCYLNKNACVLVVHTHTHIYVQHLCGAYCCIHIPYTGAYSYFACIDEVNP